MIDTKKVERHAERLERVAGGASPTPSFQVMARDAAKAIRELLEALADQPEAEEAEVEQVEQVEEPKPAPKRRGRAPKAPPAEEEPPTEGDDA